MPDDRRLLPVIQPGGSSGSPPIFERIAIVGLGLVGGSIALAARQRWPAGLVIGVDDKEVLEQAMTRHAVDVAADDLIVAAEADLVILAAPARANVGLLSELSDHVRGTAIVTDVTSTKRAVVAASRQLPPRLTFVGGHPLGGAPRGGFQHARPDLFVGRPWIFTPASDDVGAAIDRLSDFARGLGAEPHIMTPEAHDRLLAVVSHLPQLTATALMHVVGTAAGREGLALSGRGLVDVTRLASSPADIWRDICATNEDEISTALDRLIEALQALRAELGAADAIDRIFESANAWRAELTALRQAQDE